MSADRPNLLMIHCHDLGNHLNCYGARTVHSPNLDALAAEGLRFARGFCTAPQCSPSRASMFTGRYPQSNGVLGLTHRPFGWDLDADERHLAQILADAGYETTAIGVVHEAEDPRRCGYQRVEANPRARPATDATLALLRELRDRPERAPFFISTGFIEPHRWPIGLEEEYMGFVSGEFGPDNERGVDVPPFLLDTPGTRMEMAELQGSIRFVDAQVGRILTALRELGLERETLVIFTTDHGYAMPRAKCSLYDPGLAIALLMRHAGRAGWEGGIVHDDLLSNVDLLPTILDALGLPTPDNVQGRSFAPLMNGGDYTPREEVFGQLTHHDYYDPRRCIRTRTHKLILNFSSAKVFMDPSQSWRPRSDCRTPRNNSGSNPHDIELYDLSVDPWEQHNIAEVAGHREVRTELLRRLRAHLRGVDDPILRGAVTPPMHHRALALLDNA